MTVFATATDIVSAAAQELGLGAINLANTASDQSGYQIIGLLNALGEEILRAKDWQNLERIMSFTGDGITEEFPLPDDYGRQVNQTEWATSDRRPLMGPDSPQVWSWSKYGIVSVGVFFRYRILRGEYHIFPTPGDGEEFALYYISKNWVQDADDSTLFKDRITKPLDIPQFDRRMLTAGLKVKFWAQKGFDTTVLQSEYDFIFNSERAQNQGARVINLSGGGAHFLLDWSNVPGGTYYGT